MQSTVQQTKTIQENKIIKQKKEKKKNKRKEKKGKVNIITNLYINLLTYRCNRWIRLSNKIC
jgi:hypothetical protein